jgi:hypothetical protein
LKQLISLDAQAALLHEEKGKGEAIVMPDLLCGIRYGGERCLLRD